MSARAVYFRLWLRGRLSLAEHVPFGSRGSAGDPAGDRRPDRFVGVAGLARRRVIQHGLFGSRSEAVGIRRQAEFGERRDSLRAALVSRLAEKSVHRYRVGRAPISAGRPGVRLRWRAVGFRDLRGRLGGGSPRRRSGSPQRRHLVEPQRQPFCVRQARDPPTVCSRRITGPACQLRVRESGWQRGWAGDLRRRCDDRLGGAVAGRRSTVLDGRLLHYLGGRRYRRHSDEPRQEWQFPCRGPR